MKVTGDHAHVEFNAPYNDVTGTQINNYINQDEDRGPIELRPLRPANMDASLRTGCLPETRTTWTRSVMDWALNPSEKNVLLIYGLAGSGKSTLATHVVNMLREKGCLGAFVFFERDVRDHSEPSMVIRTVAHQLGSNQVQLRGAICAAVKRHSNIAHFPLESQFQKLLVEPIAPSSSTPTHLGKSSFRKKLRTFLHHKTTDTIVIVLDALDECGTPDGRQLLLRILSKLTKQITSLRFIITSRPERDIVGAFELQSHVLTRELDTSSDDVSKYLTDRIDYIKSQSPDLEQTDWPGDKAFDLLVRRSSGLFIWAATAAKFIDGYNPKERLRLILQDTSRGEAESELDDLYQKTLGSAGDWKNNEFIHDFRSIMNIVLAAIHPLSAVTIDGLRQRSDNQQSCAHVISHLGCLLQQRPEVRLLHPSFADFLFTKSRCKRDDWFFDQTALDNNLTRWCMDSLNTDLKANICNLALSPDPVNNSLPGELRYACLSWVEHVFRVSNAAKFDIAQSLRGFLYQHLLHWLQAMSILGKARDAIAILQKVSTWLSNFAPEEAKLLELVNDTVRFVRRYSDIIEIHPLLVHASALPFTPINTHIYNTFHDPLLHPVLLGTVETSWSPLLQVLTGHSDGVKSVAVSPDGTRIVSGSDDSTIRVWDVTSGIELPSELKGHHGRVLSVVFSPDNTRIVCGSEDSTVRLWDISSGVALLPPTTMQGHTASVNSVAFSPDGKLIISGSDDKTVRVWDANNGVEIGRPLEGHTDKVSSVTCSKICQENGFTDHDVRIASGSRDKTIRIWNIASDRKHLPPLQGHTDCVKSVAFSPDGRYIDSGSDDRTIRLWNSTTGTPIHSPFTGHSNWIRSVAFLPDGSRIVSGSSDKTIRVWDATTGSEVMSSLVYTASIYSVSPSPCGTRIISGSGDSKVQIWNAQSSSERISPSEGHTSYVTSVAFSQDGTRLVTGSADMAIRIWNTASGVQLLPPLTGHRDWIRSVAFSSDGARIVSGSSDKTVRIWDATTGLKILPILRGHTGWVVSVAFSLDSARIVSGSDDGTVLVWDATTGRPVLRLLQHNQPLRSVRFSSDGSNIVSRDESHRYTWDAVSGDLIYEEEDTGQIQTGGDIDIDWRSRWITDRLTNNYLSKLPSSVDYCSYSIHKRTLAVGTKSGEVLIMRFPTNLHYFA